jgi:stage II sporulation protein D
MGKTSRLILVAGILGLGTLAWQAPTALAARASETYQATVVGAPMAVSGKSGSTAKFEVSIKNTGTATWRNSGDNAVRLGTINPKDGQGRFYYESWLAVNRAATMKESRTKPGETAQFTFIGSLSGAGGRVTDKLMLVAEGVTWFGPEIEFVANVTPAIYKGELISVSQKKFDLRTGEVAKSTVKVKNTGDAIWENSGVNAVKIATANPNDRASGLRAGDWLATNRVAVAKEKTKPGDVAEFEINLQAPNRIGAWSESFGVVAEGIAWLSPKFDLEMNVSPAKWEGQWVRQSDGPVSMTTSEPAEVWMEIRNTGNTTWTAEGLNAVKLGTSRALDRESSFYDVSWPSNNRVALVSPTTVKPGEVGKFTFNLTAPAKPGQYREYFRPVVENVTWLADQGIYFDIVVSEGAAMTKPIRVGIVSTTDKITVSGGSFVVRDGADGPIVKKDSSSLTITASGSGYKLSSGEKISDYVRIVPQGNAVLTVKTEGISSSYNRFRGIIEVRRSSLSGNVWVVNVLDLEDYMKGIAEVPDGWPKEAQRAQMVAARTYAANKLKAPVADIFDLYDDTRDQVYYGYNYEAPRANLTAAAEATKGLVAKYQGEPIKAFYFSDSGGYTANNEDIWNNGNKGSALPYLRAVRDEYAKPIEWEATLTQDYLKGRFDEALGISATSSDAITDIEVTNKFESGHAKTVTFTMKSGKKIPVKMSTFDYLTDNNQIKSMLFSVSAVGSDSDAPDFEFAGTGWGHGVGMPQWGARNMAEAGKNFKEILTYYYTGVRVEPI